MSGAPPSKGIEVQVEAAYVPQRSAPERNQFYFAYHVVISNRGHDTVQLLSRHWIITDGTGRVEEVRGPGVVGEQPTLRPGDAYSYTSACPLRTPVGTMEGTYQMATEGGELFDAPIAPFTLAHPEALN